MEIGEYASLAERERTYFWHVGRREILQEALERNLGTANQNEILDVGCGPGGNMLLLEKFGRVTGLDFSPEALKFARQYNFVNLLEGRAEMLPFTDARFQLVSALDVLEHVKNDTAAMAEAYRVLKPGGFF